MFAHAQSCRGCHTADVATLKCAMSALDNLAMDSGAAVRDMLKLGAVDVLVPHVPHTDDAVAESTCSLLAQLCEDNSGVARMLADNGGFRHLFARLEALAARIQAERKRVEAAADAVAGAPGAPVSPGKRMTGHARANGDAGIEPGALEESVAACVANALYVLLLRLRVQPLRPLPIHLRYAPVLEPRTALWHQTQRPPC